MKLRTFSTAVLVALILSFASLGFSAAQGNEAAGLFKSHCSMCHGLNGKGYAAIHTPDFTSPKWQASITDKEIIHTITNGKKGTTMPAFGGKLKADQIEGLMHYIRSLKSEKQN